VLWWKIIHRKAHERRRFAGNFARAAASLNEHPTNPWQRRPYSLTLDPKQFKPYPTALIGCVASEKAYLTRVITPQASFLSGSSKQTMAVTGVMLVIFLFAMDATIVATSMPTIVAKLGGLELYSWVFSIYMLTSALATPVFGKLADLFSRRNLMLVGIVIFIVGSTLCGAAQSMAMMVLFRAIQGIGGGAIYALAFILVGILYPVEKRAKMQGVISSIWGLASILGPLAGGIIVDNWSWRWIFFVNLPISAAASSLIIAGLSEDDRQTSRSRLDWLGATILLLALLLLFYALSRSAQTKPPLGLEFWGPVTLAGVMLAIFIVIERRATEPIIPIDLFHLKLFGLCAAVAALASMGAFGAITYLPLYLQGVYGLAASRAGLVLLVLSLGWTAGSLIGGQWINRFGYRFVALAGMGLMAFGYGLFLSPGFHVGVVAVVVTAIAIGVGMGMSNLTTLVAAQTAVRVERIGVATSTVMLFRTFGGAFAVSLMGTVLFGKMTAGLEQLAREEGVSFSAVLRDKITDPQNLLDPATRALIPPEHLPSLTGLLGDAVWYAFLTTFLLMLIGLVLSFFIGPYTPATTPRSDERRRSCVC
jgi:EmrB/QacA subfamily drug resistance transporter